MKKTIAILALAAVGLLPTGTAIIIGTEAMAIVPSATTILMAGFKMSTVTVNR